MEDSLVNLPNFDNVELDDDGTPLGTFKSVKSLKDAYDELRSCFTKNAMELSKLKQELASSDKEISPDEVEKADAPTLHIWEKASWSQDLESFYQQNPEASEYSEEINKLIQEDENIERSNAPLYSAWIKVLKEKANKADIDKFANDPLLQNRIIQDYLNTVKSSKTAPPIMASKESVGISTPKRKVNSLDEAFDLAKKLFE